MRGKKQGIRAAVFDTNYQGGEKKQAYEEVEKAG